MIEYDHYMDIIHINWLMGSWTVLIWLFIMSDNNDFFMIGFLSFFIIKTTPWVCNPGLPTFRTYAEFSAFSSFLDNNSGIPILAVKFRFLVKTGITENRAFILLKLGVYTPKVGILYLESLDFIPRKSGVYIPKSRFKTSEKLCESIGKSVGCRWI